MCQPMFVEQQEEIVHTCQFIVSTSSWLVNVIHQCCVQKISLLMFWQNNIIYSYPNS